MSTSDLWRTSGDGVQAEPRITLELLSHCKNGNAWRGLPLWKISVPPHPAYPSTLIKSDFACITRSGASQVTWRLGAKRVNQDWHTGSFRFWSSNTELTDFQTLGTQAVLAVELDSAKLMQWSEGQGPGVMEARQRLPRQILDTNEQILYLYRCMETEINQGCPSGALFAQALCISLVTLLAGRYGLATKPKSAGRLTQAKLKQLHSYIEEHITQDISLKELASQVNLSPRHFCRSFKQTSGLSPLQYVMELRLTHARQLLRTTTEPIADIAMHLGFSSAAHFSVTFRNFMNCSPRMFRQQQ